jgi:hypothetical protein
MFFLRPPKALSQQLFSASTAPMMVASSSHLTVIELNNYNIESY